MRRRSGRLRAMILLALLVVPTLVGCSVSRPHGPNAVTPRSEMSEELEDEILSAQPYDEDGQPNAESTEEKAGGVMVSTLFVGVILALAAVPLLLFGPLGLL